MLNPIERVLLDEQLEKLNKALGPGISVLNWLSLGILEFVASFKKASLPISTSHSARIARCRRDCLQTI